MEDSSQPNEQNPIFVNGDIGAKAPYSPDKDVDCFILEEDNNGQEERMYVLAMHLFCYVSAFALITVTSYLCMRAWLLASTEGETFVSWVVLLCEWANEGT